MFIKAKKSTASKKVEKEHYFLHKHCAYPNIKFHLKAHNFQTVLIERKIALFQSILQNTVQILPWNFPFKTRTIIKRYLLNGKRCSFTIDFVKHKTFSIKNFHLKTHKYQAVFIDRQKNLLFQNRLNKIFFSSQTLCIFYDEIPFKTRTIQTVFNERKNDVFQSILSNTNMKKNELPRWDHQRKEGLKLPTNTPRLQ